MPHAQYYNLNNSSKGPASNLFHIQGEKMCADPYLKPYPCMAQKPPHMRAGERSQTNPPPTGKQLVECSKYSLADLAKFNCMRPGFNGRPVHFEYSRVSDDNWCNECCSELDHVSTRVL
jgi:hypothetical protein